MIHEKYMNFHEVMDCFRVEKKNILRKNKKNTHNDAEICVYDEILR